MLGSVLIAALVGAPAAAPEHRNTATTYTCRFGPHGIVVIDTRDPGASITIAGRRRPATHGSYFYQTEDGEIAVMFGPDMRFWEYDGHRDDHCIARPNRR